MAVFRILQNPINLTSCNSQKPCHFWHGDCSIFQFLIFSPIFMCPILWLLLIPFLKRFFRNPDPVINSNCFYTVTFNQIINRSFTNPQHFGNFWYGIRPFFQIFSRFFSIHFLILHLVCIPFLGKLAIFTLMCPAISLHSKTFCEPASICLSSLVLEDFPSPVLSSRFFPLEEAACIYCSPLFQKALLQIEVSSMILWFI